VKKTEQTYFLGDIVLALIVVQAWAVFIKRVVGNRFFLQLAKVDLIQAIINPDSCAFVCRMGTKWNFFVDNVFSAGKVRRPRTSLYRTDIAFRIYFLLLMGTFSFQTQYSNYAIAILFALYLVYFLFYSFFPPKLTLHVPKQFVSFYQLFIFFMFITS
jgi:hypothetical protein